MKYINKLLQYKKEFIQYFFAGGFCALVNWGCFYIFSSNFEISYILSGLYAFIISNTINFILCKLIFKSKGLKKTTEFILVTITSIIAIIIDLSSMTLFIKIFNILPILGKILGTGCAFIFNYLFRQFFIFDSSRK